MSTKIKLLGLFLLLVSGFICAQDARLLRFPSIHSDKLVFTYAGNLYLTSSEGGLARRLTDHVGVEIFRNFHRMVRKSGLQVNMMEIPNFIQFHQMEVSQPESLIQQH